MPACSLIVSRQFVSKSQPYFCMRCQTHLFNINGDILVMWTGPGYPPTEIPLNMFWVHHRCRGCKKDYNVYFQV